MTAVLVALAAGCAAPSAPAPPARPSEVAAPVAPHRAEERELRADALFSDHMVLQRDAKAPVWGTATPGITVTVTLGDQREEAVTDTAGRWIATLPPLPAGGPFELRVAAGKAALTFRDVLVGEVWIASGQSNMAFQLRRSAGGEEAIARADLPRLRLFTVPRDVAERPRTIHGGRWEVSSPASAPGFSAVAFHFGRELMEHLGVPVGIIHSSWSGSPIEAWMSAEALASDPSSAAITRMWAEKIAAKRAEIDAYEPQWRAWRERADRALAAGEPYEQPPEGPEGPRHPWYPSNLYNAMLRPLAPYGIRGFIWYQGEGNRSRATQYRTLFPALIREWRGLFGGGKSGGEPPFLYVQIAGYGKDPPEPAESPSAELREAQLMALDLPRTAMVVTTDISDPEDVHPTNKRDVGHRLALAARAVAYGEDVVHSGPIYDSMQVEGDAIRLRFKHVGGGLRARGGALQGFAIAGEDGRFQWAEARIEGDTVRVRRKGLRRPVAVRYGWRESPACNLFNAEGLPASPFRTDGPRPGS